MISKEISTQKRNRNLTHNQQINDLDTEVPRVVLFQVILQSRNVEDIASIMWLAIEKDCFVSKGIIIGEVMYSQYSAHIH